MSRSTVKTHLGHILDKLGQRDRVQTVVFGYEHALAGPGAAGPAEETARRQEMRPVPGVLLLVGV